MLKNFASALQDAEKSTEVDETWTKGYYRKAKCLRAMNDATNNDDDDDKGEAGEEKKMMKKSRFENVREAIDVLRVGARYDPTNAQANAFLRTLELESLSLAKDCFEMKARAKEMFREGKFEEAAEMYGEALRDEEMRRSERKGEFVVADESNGSGGSSSGGCDGNTLRATLFLNRAECYRQIGKMRECEKDCEEALQLQPKNEKGLLRRALCREYFERFEEALEDFESAKRLSPSSLLASSGIERCKKMIKSNQ
jgi:tetratricopeptide (TPR) repeat protein